MNGIKNNPVVLDQIENGCCFLSLKRRKKKIQGNESCKLNFCGLEDIRWLHAKMSSFPISGAESRAPELKAPIRKPLLSVNSKVSRM